MTPLPTAATSLKAPQLQHLTMHSTAPAQCRSQLPLLMLMLQQPLLSLVAQLLQKDRTGLPRMVLAQVLSCHRRQ